jgi:DNA-binding MarR family transcriptional regulator
MGTAISALNFIRRLTQSAILICHHTGWIDTHERGHSSLRAACRVVMKLSNNDGLITLTCEKINGAKPFEPRYFRLLPSAESVVLVPTSRITGRDEPPTQKQIDILTALNLTIFEDGATFTQLLDHLNVAKSSLNYSLSRLIERSHISKNGKGHSARYKITAIGHDILLCEEAEVQSTQDQNADSLNSTELSLNWHIQKDAIRSKAVQHYSASGSQSSSQFSESSAKVQSNGSSSVQSSSFKKTEQLNSELNKQEKSNDHHLGKHNGSGGAK